MIAEPRPSHPDAELLPIYVSGVHKAYRTGAVTAPVLNGVDLAVPRGRCVYLAGPSGSGKTTLLSILGCILSADRGKVRILGRDVAGLAPGEMAALRRNRVGFVFQRFHLLKGLNVLENACVPLIVAGVPRRAAARRAMPLLAAVGLADKASAQPKNLSAGQCQRVALARALACNPDLILADEPTAALDAANGQQVMALIRRLTTEQGRTAVVVTHDPRIFPFADRVYWLEGGRIVEAADGLLAPPAVHEQEGGSP
jgi:putative ABC transport system ATP-binding protein